MTPEDHIENFSVMLQAHLDQVGYPRPNPLSDFSLHITKEELREMDVDELGELAFDLANAAYSVGDEYNRQKAKAERCHTRIAQLVGKKLDHSIYKAEDRWMSAAFKNPDAREYWETRQTALTAAMRLEAQSLRLSDLVKVVNNIIYSRK